MIYCQKYLNIVREGKAVPLPKQKVKQGECPYCKGKGYHQPLLGGTETCYQCAGSGSDKTEKTG
ncbi:YuiA family protein [Salisediminibacterium halotolerans]|uniref:YuiA family protein n=1 Tax=Salisediminibacterium halotolerans TaxID=517425 RepID=UPI0015A6BB8C